VRLLRALIARAGQAALAASEEAAGEERAALLAVARAIDVLQRTLKTHHQLLAAAGTGEEPDELAEAVLLELQRLHEAP